MVLELETIRRAVAEVFAGSPIIVAYAHGSRVHGRPRPDSDLDIGYCLRPTVPSLSLLDEAGLELALADHLGLPVDLRDLGAAPLNARGMVLEKAARIYCTDEEFRIAFERDTLSRYHDFKPQVQALRCARLQLLADEVS